MKSIDKAIKACDQSFEYDKNYRGAHIQITFADKNGTRNVYLNGRVLWQDEGNTRKVALAVENLIDKQKEE